MLRRIQQSDHLMIEELNTSETSAEELVKSVLTGRFDDSTESIIGALLQRGAARAIWQSLYSLDDSTISSEASSKEYGNGYMNKLHSPKDPMIKEKHTSEYPVTVDVEKGSNG
uniref:Uncharacterized protein n=1 Tax=Arundo donax TaxID=35708 RepID=A0A0A9AA49_ARUDO